jgi:hypothetical protein
MLPKVSVHRFASAPFSNVESYRRIVGGRTPEFFGVTKAFHKAIYLHVNRESAKLLESSYDSSSCTTRSSRRSARRSALAAPSREVITNASIDTRRPLVVQVSTSSPTSPG